MNDNTMKTCPLKPPGEVSKLVSIDGGVAMKPPNACDGPRCAWWMNVTDATGKTIGGNCSGPPIAYHIGENAMNALVNIATAIGQKGIAEGWMKPAPVGDPNNPAKG